MARDEQESDEWYCLSPDVRLYYEREMGIIKFSEKFLYFPKYLLKNDFGGSSLEGYHC